MFALDVEQLKRNLNRGTRPPGAKPVILQGGPLDGYRTLVSPQAKPGASFGIVQQHPRGLLSVEYKLDEAGVWRWDGWRRGDAPWDEPSNMEW